MVLKRFVKIKDYRVFADFTWPNGLKPFTKFNVVYGWNGTGKTTLASLFRKMERRENVIEGTVEIESDTGNRIAGTAFDHSGLPQVRVFDRDFVAQSLEAISDGMAPPVYYIGKTTIDQAKLLQGLKAERVHIIAEKDKATKENALCEREFDKYKSAQAKAIKDVMIGSREYGAYNKSRLDAGIEKVRSRNLVALSEEEKRNFHLQRQAVPKAGIVLPDLNMSKARDIPCVVIGLLGESVASAAIDELAKNPELSSWVYAGLKIHDNKNGDCTCRFCGNTFTLARRREFENHFNDAYSSFIKRIDIVIDEVAQLKLSIRAVMSKLPHPSQLYENLAREYGSVRDCFNKEAESFCEWLGLLEQRLKEKKTNPFERMAIEGALTTGEGFAQGLAAQYEHITGIVDRHTAFADNLETTRRCAENMLVGDLLREMVCAYDEYAAKVKASRDVITSLTGSLAETNSKIAAIEREVTESRRPVDELNNELAAYLGRDELKFVLQDSGYALMRHERIAENLSEGERTAITFLYFLKTLRTKEFDLRTGVVLVDDPVSSLDANSLFAAFAYMKGGLLDVGQLFVFTHNFSFFRNVKNWYKHINKRCGDEKRAYDASFYALDVALVDGVRHSRLMRLDPLLEKYESEYHYLFKQVYQCANDPEGHGQLSMYCPLPNVARRLLDSFLSYKFPDKNAESLSDKMRVALGDDIGTQQRLLRFLNMYSHVDGMPMPEFDASLLSECKVVMQLIMKLVEKLDKVHYDGMLRVMQRN